jgi:hypothetical protein
LSLKRAKIGKNTPVLNNQRGFYGAYPVLFGARARPSLVPRSRLTWGEKDTRQTACSAVHFPDLRVEDERDVAIPFQNSEFVLYVLFAAGLERHLSATRWTDE